MNEYPIIKNGDISREEIDGASIKRFLEQRIVDQTIDHMWFDAKVELKDGRIVTIRDVRIREDGEIKRARKKTS